ncbi:uncharacterized protein METZ01_LOCUS412887 [marine metagenome]|uniref:Uncharacterized protein n=1 Tax=marine metagenome TaxID=408172 RepID=A0A382WML5_9ZZZZ
MAKGTYNVGIIGFLTVCSYPIRNGNFAITIWVLNNPDNERRLFALTE